MKIGFHASHEQFKPSNLLELVKMAEFNGFNAALSSDHFHPWSKRQGQSGFAWSWLGAAMQSTSLSFGVVNAPGQRYHPAIIAQATATLAEMFPDRFWMAVGSGQILNEGITGDKWPIKANRNERLHESANIIRSLWAGEMVTYHGHVNIEEARLFTRPEKPPLLIGAGITKETIEWLGKWADGLITTPKPINELKEIIKAFRKGGGKGKPMYLKVQISYAQNEEEALKGAFDQWKSNAFKNPVQTDLRSPDQFDYLSEVVKPEDMHKKVRISANTDKHVEWLSEFIELGFEHLYLHNVNQGQERFIKDFGKKVLPELLD